MNPLKECIRCAGKVTEGKTVIGRFMVPDGELKGPKRKKTELVCNGCQYAYSVIHENLTS